MPHQLRCIAARDGGSARHRHQRRVIASTLPTNLVVAHVVEVQFVVVHEIEPRDRRELRRRGIDGEFWTLISRRHRGAHHVDDLRAPPVG
jgi:hypothetical protein